MSDDGLRAALVAIKAKLQERSDEGEAHLFLNISYWELEELLAEYPADSPHLTDDGAAAFGEAPGNASAFGLSTGATPTAAPSSPHLVVDRDALIALQKAHRYVADSNLGEPGCACGLEFPGGFDYIEHAEHVAGRVLSLLGRES